MYGPFHGAFRDTLPLYLLAEHGDSRVPTKERVPHHRGLLWGVFVECKRDGVHCSSANRVLNRACGP